MDIRNKILRKLEKILGLNRDDPRFDENVLSPMKSFAGASIVEKVKGPNKRKCPGCHKKILKSYKRCPLCREFIHKENYRGNLKRNLKIVALADTGKYTLEELGQKFGLTRERIRQIYKAMTGLHYRVRIDKNKVKRVVEKKVKMNQVVYNCVGCGIPVKRKYRHGKYCDYCHILSSIRRRSLLKTFVCVFCGEKYHPIYNYKSPSIMKKKTIGNCFCSMDCYSKYKRKKLANILYKNFGRKWFTVEDFMKVSGNSYTSTYTFLWNLNKMGIVKKERETIRRRKCKYFLNITYSQFLKTGPLRLLAGTKKKK